MNSASALPPGTELADNYRIESVLGAGGFGITYLAWDKALKGPVTIKEYFPNDFAARGPGGFAAPRTASCASDYRWGLDRFLAEAQTLAKFRHPNIVRVRYFFAANSTGYMVLDFEEGQSFKSWLKALGRAPRQSEIDAILAPLLDALDTIHKADFLHRDIAPDNIIIRKDGSPVLIDFGSARGEIATHSKTVSALVKPGYSPYEQYAERSSQQGPWTDIYALAATLYHAVAGKRPPDAPSRWAEDRLVSAREAALSAYRPRFLAAIDRGLALDISARPPSIAAWRGELLAPEEQPSPARGAAMGWFTRALERRRERREKTPEPSAAPVGGAPAATIPPPPDAPGPQGGLLDFFERLGPQGGGAKTAGVSHPDLRASVRGAAAPADHTGNDVLPPGDTAGQRPPPRVLAPVPRKRLRPRPMGTGGRLRPVLIKLLIGAGVAAAAVALQDRIPRFEGRGSAVPASQRDLFSLAETLHGHTGPVTAAAYSGDGRTIVTAGADSTLRIWNSAGGLVRTIELDRGPAAAVALSGNRVLTGHNDGGIDLWETGQADKIASFRRNEANIWMVTFAGEADRFAAAGHDGKVALWDVRVKDGPVHVFEGPPGAIKALAWSPHGPYLASGGADRTIRLWNTETLDPVRTYRGHRDFVTALAFSPDGRALASGGLDGQIRIWSTASRRLLRILRGHRGRVSGLAFLSGSLLASGGDDGLVRLWDWRRTSGAVETLAGHTGAVNAVAFSAGGGRLVSASSDGTARLWNPRALSRTPGARGE